jgi:metal-responsive CopG/Arc/MetJ family transcriptional regulator
VELHRLHADPSYFTSDILVYIILGYKPEVKILSKEKVQDDKILLRLPSTLTAAMDQIIREQLTTLNRSEFIRRAVRYTIDNIETFKSSEAATITEKTEIESIAKVNVVRDLYKQIFEYKERMLREPNASGTEKQLAFLIFLIGEMIFRQNEI